MIDRAVQLCRHRAPLPGWFLARSCAILLFAALPLRAPAEKLEQLKPQGYVNDFAGVLDAEARAQITALCAEVDQKAHAQIAVVTIRSLDGAAASDLANRLFKQWGVGYKPDDRGVLILLAPNDQKYWVEVGYGLEPILPDGKVGGFGREIVPLLRQNNYGGAVAQLTSRIAEVIAQDRGVTLGTRLPQRPPGHRESPSSGGLAKLIFVLFILLFVGGILPLIRAVSGGGRPGGRRGGWWLFGSGMGGGGGWGGGSFGGGGGFGGFGGGGSGGGGAGGGW